MPSPKDRARFPTTAGRINLSKRFDLPYESWMQDWEWEVADAARIPEFLAVLSGEPLRDDERISLAEMLLESFDEHLVSTGKHHGDWGRFADVILSRSDLHLDTLKYWACDGSEQADTFAVAALVRTLLGACTPADPPDSPSAAEAPKEVWTIHHGEGLVGSTTLSWHDRPMGIRGGRFEPGPAYAAVRSVFLIFAGAGRDQQLAAEYFAARDALELQVRNRQGERMPVIVHILDYADEIPDCELLVEFILSP